eukprot:TRINITY_DN7244_c0_g1_i1.p1 TRINITY_DN7244_c0_g1~~TRINITY_DN7244_c0_g1_i1.p1  ORF type:complete len:142 (+),score=31.68 TRINITY_DN7244_c0_g1_i1:135-560(+)
MHATSCVPFVSENVTFIPGVGGGLFWDAALANMDLNFHLEGKQGLVLSDDSKMYGSALNFWHPWHTPNHLHRKNVSIVYVTEEFREKLPDRKLPSLPDWFHHQYVIKPELRKKNWTAARELSLETFPHELSELLIHDFKKE